MRRFAPREGPLASDGAASRHIRRVERLVVAAAAGLAVLGFLAYYLPVYLVPHAFPAASVTLPRVGRPVPLPWGELSWAVLLTTVELLLLTLLNLASVHEIAVTTGFLNAATRRRRPSRSVDRPGEDVAGCSPVRHRSLPGHE